MRPRGNSISMSIQTPEENLSQQEQCYDLKYPQVRRGQIYVCDFGKPFGSEQGYKRYALIVQNNTGNRTSPTTIVLACTSRKKANLPVHYKFVLSEKNMKDYNKKRVGEEVKNNTLLAEQIRTVDKRRLRIFIGTMTNEFMEKLQPIIDTSLGLKRKEKIVVVNSTKDLNMAQIQLLSKVDIEKILEISQKAESKETKIKQMLKLFNFNLESDGVQYLIKAIYLATNTNYFSMDTLCEKISKDEKILNNEKVQKIIIDTIKERFNFKESVSIDFIRLINILLIKEMIPEIESNKLKEKSNGKIEKILSEYLKNNLNRLNFSLTIKENIDYFLDSIDMPTDEIIMQSFVIACNTKRITYAKIINQLKEIYPEKMSAELRKTLRDNFKKWLEKNPELATQCRQISIMNLLKIFAKQFA